MRTMTETQTPTEKPTLVQTIRQQIAEGREQIAQQLAKITERMDADMQKVRDKYADQITALETELAEADQALANLSGRATRATNKSSGGRGRPRGTGKRADEAVQIIRDNPGITIPQIAERMGLKSPNYLYRLLPGLVQQGRVWKDGQGWHPAHDPRP